MGLWSGIGGKLGRRAASLYRAHPHRVHVPGLLIVVACVFGPTLAFDFAWDDHLLIVGNQKLTRPGEWQRTFTRSFWDLHDTEDRSRSFYRPVVSISFMIDRALWGLDPKGFHLTNLVIFALCACLVYAVCLALLRNPLAALLGALVYVLLPVRVENVAWISGRTDLCCAAFFFAAYLLFLAWLRNNGRPRLLLALSLASYLLSMLSKEMAITLPLLLAATWWVLERDALRGPRVIRALVPFVAISIAYLVMRSRVLGDAIDMQIHGSLGERIASLAMVLAKYVGLLLLIVSPDPHHPDGFVQDPATLGNLLYIALSVAFLAWLARRRRRRDLLTYAALWFAVTLLPVFNLGAFGDVLFADRFLNIPSVGWALVIGLVIRWWLQKPAAGRRIAVAAGVGLYLVLCVVSLRSNLFYWSNDELLFSRAVQTSPRSAYVHMNLARGLRLSGKYDLALESYDRAIALDPEDGLICLNKGVALEHAGRDDEALAFYQEAHRLRYRGHTLYYNIGNVLKKQGRLEEAVGAYRQSLELRDDYRVHNNLGECLLALGRVTEAEKHFRQGLEMSLTRIGCNNLGVVLMRQGRIEEAIPHFRRAIELDPRALSPRLNLARLLYLKDRLDEAHSHVQFALEVLRQQPDLGREWPYADALAKLDAQIRMKSADP